MRYKRMGHNINAMEQSAYFVFDRYAFYFNCTPVGWGLDLMWLRHKAI